MVFFTNFRVFLFFSTNLINSLWRRGVLISKLSRRFVQKRFHLFLNFCEDWSNSHETGKSFMKKKSEISQNFRIENFWSSHFQPWPVSWKKFRCIFSCYWHHTASYLAPSWSWEPQLSVDIKHRICRQKIRRNVVQNFPSNFLAWSVSDSPKLEIIMKLKLTPWHFFLQTERSMLSLMKLKALITNMWTLGHESHKWKSFMYRA